MREEQKKKVLVIDDEPDIRAYVSTVLKISGYVSIGAKNGEKGLKAARLEKPDLVILDVMMPHIEDGTRCYQNFKTEENIQNIPIIMLSAIARKTFLHTISRIHLADGHTLPEPQGYLEKPPDAGELSTLVSEVLRRWPRPSPKPGP